jgi:hypothetical protein
MLNVAPVDMWRSALKMAAQAGGRFFECHITKWLERVSEVHQRAGCSYQRLTGIFAPERVRAR